MSSRTPLPGQPYWPSAGGLTYGGASDHDDVFAFGDEFGLDYK